MNDLLSDPILQTLPRALCARWHRLRSGGGRQSSLPLDARTRPLWFAEAFWWNRPVPESVIEALYAAPEQLACVGTELLEYLLHHHRPVDRLIQTLEQQGSCTASGVARYAIAYRTRAQDPARAEQTLTDAIDLLTDHDPWALGQVLRLRAYWALFTEHPDADALYAAVPSHPLSHALEVASRAVIESRDDVDIWVDRLQETGPATALGRLLVARALQCAREQGVTAAIPVLEGTLDSRFVTPAQAWIPGTVAVQHACEQGDFDRARRWLTRIEPGNPIQVATHQFLLGWVEHLEGHTHWASRLEPLLRVVERPSLAGKLGALPLRAFARVCRPATRLCDTILERQAVADPHSPRPSVECRLPLEMGAWDVIGPLAAGGQASLWTACRRVTGHPAVVKWLPPNDGHTWLLEARTLCRIQHPHVVQLMDLLVADDYIAERTRDLGEDRIESGSIGLVLPRAAGSLGEHRVPAGARLAVIRALLDALEHIHALGLLHLDIKPPNILVSDPDAAHLGVWLADFGVANLSWGSETERLGGTPAFMPPEQRRGDLRNMGPWTDLYALGRMVQQWTPAGSNGWTDWLTHPDPAGRPDSVATARAALPVDLTALDRDGWGPPDPAHDPAPELAGGTTFVFADEIDPSHAHAATDADSGTGRPAGVAAPVENRPVPLGLPEVPTPDEPGWVGLLAWRRPAWIDRGDGALERLWQRLEDVNASGRCQVVRLAGVGRGRRRLLEELVFRANLTGRCLARLVDHPPQPDLAAMFHHCFDRTPLAPIAARVVRQDDPVTTLNRLTQASAELNLPLVLALGDRYDHDTRWLDRIDGQPGRALVVLEDEQGTPLAQLPPEVLTRIGCAVAGMIPSEAHAIAERRHGSPGWMLRTLAILERQGALLGPVGQRRSVGIIGWTPWDTVRDELSFTHDPEQGEAALRTVLAGGSGISPALQQLLLHANLAHRMDHQLIPTDRWFEAPW